MKKITQFVVMACVLWSIIIVLVHTYSSMPSNLHPYGRMIGALVVVWGLFLLPVWFGRKGDGGKSRLLLIIASVFIIAAAWIGIYTTLFLASNMDWKVVSILVCSITYIIIAWWFWLRKKKN